MTHPLAVRVLAVAGAVVLAACTSAPAPTPAPAAFEASPSVPRATPAPSPSLATDYPDPRPAAETWTSLQALAPVPAGQFDGPGNELIGSAVLHGLTYLFWKEDRLGPNVIEIWSSADDETWTRVYVDGRPFDATITAVRADGDRLLLIGAQDPNGLAIVTWTSTDAVHWQRANPVELIGRDAGPRFSVVAGATRFVAWSYLGSEVLTSTDGVTWSPSVTPLDPTALLSSVEPYRGGYVAVGGAFATPGTTHTLTDARARAWWSPDGTHWTAAALVGDSTLLRTVFVTAHGLIARAIPDCGACAVFPPVATWTSPDGKTWTDEGLKLDQTSDTTSDGARLVGFVGSGADDLAWSDDGLTWHVVAPHAYPTQESASADIVSVPNGVLLLTRPNLDLPVAQRETDVQLLLAQP